MLLAEEAGAPVGSRFVRVVEYRERLKWLAGIIGMNRTNRHKTVCTAYHPCFISLAQIVLPGRVLIRGASLCTGTCHQNYLLPSVTHDRTY